ncbi:hypothetical protein CP965_13305 [Halarcobacter mediterraneus]|uniref:HTH luxR-type domain-containing protein n=1 Tax=Halarcobacter mediterraneus TaxID=2023153 RepID=A0A4V1M0Y8_9BACT|nr:hypothetical protein [Halarcobacter mediterraneus]RXK11515.1 hypothetical protein CP965_13305 [Halarcobacter mediterraneus]
MNFTQSLTKHIDKLVGTLKSEKDLKEVLKRKLTKKELKTFVAIEEGKSVQETMELLNADEDRINELYKTVCKKLNQEKIKKELIFL